MTRSLNSLEGGLRAKGRPDAGDFKTPFGQCRLYLHVTLPRDLPLPPSSEKLPRKGSALLMTVISSSCLQMARVSSSHSEQWGSPQSSKTDNGNRTSLPLSIEEPLGISVVPRRFWVTEVPQLLELTFLPQRSKGKRDLGGTLV